MNKKKGRRVDGESSHGDHFYRTAIKRHGLQAAADSKNLAHGENVTGRNPRHQPSASEEKNRRKKSRGGAWRRNPIGQRLSGQEETTGPQERKILGARRGGTHPWRTWPAGPGSRRQQQGGNGPSVTAVLLLHNECSSSPCPLPPPVPELLSS